MSGEKLESEELSQSSKTLEQIRKLFAEERIEYAREMLELFNVCHEDIQIGQSFPIKKDKKDKKDH